MPWTPFCLCHPTSFLHFHFQMVDPLIEAYIERAKSYFALLEHATDSEMPLDHTPPVRRTEWRKGCLLVCSWLFPHPFVCSWLFPHSVTPVTDANATRRPPAVISRCLFSRCSFSCCSASLSTLFSISIIGVIQTVFLKFIHSLCCQSHFHLIHPPCYLSHSHYIFSRVVFAIFI